MKHDRVPSNANANNMYAEGGLFNLAFALFVFSEGPSDTTRHGTYQ
jgi:hypothetical protein